MSRQQDISRAEVFLATNTELTQASVLRLLMILFSRGVHFATPNVRAWLSLDHIRLFLPDLIKSIVSPGQAALRETPKNGLRLTALPSQTGFGGETEAGQDARSNNSGAHDHRRFRPRPSPYALSIHLVSQWLSVTA